MRDLYSSGSKADKDDPARKTELQAKKKKKKNYVTSQEGDRRAQRRERLTAKLKGIDRESRRDEKK